MNGEGWRSGCIIVCVRVKTTEKAHAVIKSKGDEGMTQYFSGEWKREGQRCAMSRR